AGPLQRRSAEVSRRRPGARQSAPGKAMLLAPVGKIAVTERAPNRAAALPAWPIIFRGTGALPAKRARLAGRRRVGRPLPQPAGSQADRADHPLGRGSRRAPKVLPRAFRKFPRLKMLLTLAPGAAPRCGS